MGETLDETFLSLAETALIFDDLERCKIPVDELFGFINQFVEHNGQKIILIANEEELTSDNNVQYAKIKEKLVGTSLRLCASPHTIIKHFIAEMPEGTAKICAEQNEKLILRVFNELKIDNYRSLRHALYDFSRLLSKIKPVFSPFMEETENAQEARRRLLILVLVMDMQARRANNDDINLQNLLEAWKNFHKNKGAPYKTQNNPLYNNAIKATEYIAKFSDGLEADALFGEPPETIFPYYELAYFLLRGSFNADSVRQHLRKHFLFKSPRLLPIWERLNNAVHYSWNEAEFHTLLKEVEAELTAQTMTDLSVIFHSAALFIYMEEEQDFCPAFLKPDIATYFNLYLDALTEFQKMEEFGLTKEFLLFHYGFSLPVKADNPKFTAIIEHHNKLKEL